MTNKEKLMLLINRRDTIMNKGKSTQKLLNKLNRQITALTAKVEN